MKSDRLSELLIRYLGGTRPERKPVSIARRAKDLLAAIDAGGVPLNPFIVNDIALRLGLGVAAEARRRTTLLESAKFWRVDNMANTVYKLLMAAFLPLVAGNTLAWGTHGNQIIAALAQ